MICVLKQTVNHISARPVILCCFLLNQPSTVTHICRAISVVQEIPYGKRRPATSGRTQKETLLRIKKSTISSDAYDASSLVVYLPVTHTSNAHAEHAKHVAWAWRAAPKCACSWDVNAQACRTYTEALSSHTPFNYEHRCAHELAGTLEQQSK